MLEDDDAYAHDDPSEGDERLLAVALTPQVARALFSHLGSLHAIAASDVATIRAAGVSRTHADRVCAAMELGRRLVARPTAATVLGPADAASILVPRLLSAQTEQVHVLYLNSRSRLIRAQVLATGGQDRAMFDAREILGGALRVRATGLVVGHNHPSGDPEPSSDDIIATRRLFDAASVLGLRLVDHLVVAGTAWASLALKGHLPGHAGLSPVVAAGFGERGYSMPHRRNL